MVSFVDYAKGNPTGEKHILVVIDAAGSPIYLSSNGYVTGPVGYEASLPNTAFKEAIANGGIPRLNREAGSLLGGRGVSSWGSVTLSTHMYRGTDLRTANLGGKSISVKMIGPPSANTYSDASNILTGYVSSMSGVGRGSTTIQVADRSKRLDDTLALNRYNAASESAYFPANSDKKTKQVVLGTCNNVPCTLIDSNLNKYQVSDPAWPVFDIDAVYFNGVSVSFTKDLPTNTFTVVTPANSNETVTAKVRGVKESGVHLSTTTQVVSWVLRTFTPFNTAGQVDIAGLSSGPVGYLLDGEVTASAVMDDLTRGCFSTYYVSQDDKLTVRPMVTPSAGGPRYTEAKHMQLAKWEEVEEVYYSVPFSYDQNWATLSVLGAVNNPNFEVWLKGENRKGTSESLAILSTYPLATRCDEVRTFFTTQSDAQAVADSIRTFHGTRRYRLTVEVPFEGFWLPLLSSVELYDTGGFDGNYVVLGVEDDYSSATPKFTLRLWK